MPDRDSVDLQIMAGGRYRPVLDFQLKATTTLGETRSGFYSFRLSIKNYNDLCVQTQTPRLLVVFNLPKDSLKWMTVTEKKLEICGTAYWLSLQSNHEDVTNQETVTVYIPQQNKLNVEPLSKFLNWMIF